MPAADFATNTRLHPLVAIRAVRALKANPEDTSQIFVIFRALRGRSGVRLFRRFAGSPTGQAILREKRDLLPVLENRAALAALPDGSMGRAYFDFMEQEKLSANGLVTASQSWEQDVVPPDVDRFRNRMRDAHDLTHILTGYGRDPLGELCLLAFMNRHSKNAGQLLIVAMSWTRLPGSARAAVIQAWRNGAKARWFQDLDYEALLARPLEDVRRELNIPAPTRYRAVTA
jgi:ubiquinone biosynthesis protein COQ4